MNHDLADDLAALARTRDQTLPYFNADPAMQARRYAPGKWTLRQFLLHTVDCEGVLLDRLRRVLAEEQPLLPAFDENRWNDRLFSEQRDLRAAEALFVATRAAVIELAGLCPPELHGRTGTHSVKGTRTFAGLVRFIHQHNAHHAEQIAAIAAGRPWTPRPDDPLNAAYIPTPPTPAPQPPLPVP